MRGKGHTEGDTARQASDAEPSWAGPSELAEQHYRPSVEAQEANTAQQEVEPQAAQTAAAEAAAEQEGAATAHQGARARQGIPPEFRMCTQAPHWICPQCGRSNWRTRLACQRCHQPHPAQAAHQAALVEEALQQAFSWQEREPSENSRHPAARRIRAKAESRAQEGPQATYSATEWKQWRKQGYAPRAGANSQRREGKPHTAAERRPADVPIAEEFRPCNKAPAWMCPCGKRNWRNRLACWSCQAVHPEATSHLAALREELALLESAREEQDSAYDPLAAGRG